MSSNVVVDMAARPRINTGIRDLTQVTRDAVWALQRTNDPPEIFRRGSSLCRLEEGEDGHVRSRELTNISLKYELAERTEFYKVERGMDLAARPPGDLAGNILASTNLPFPGLDRITRVPVFGVDGVLVNAPGYHEGSRLYYAPSEGLAVPEVPVAPRPEDLARAKDLILEDLLIDFPFADDADRAHAISLLLLPFARDLITGPTPNHLVESPTPGSGKGLLVDATLRISLGHVPIIAQAKDEEEWRRRITSHLRQAAEAIIIDNITGSLDSGVLASALTTPLYWEDRLLGSNTMLRLPVRCVWVCAANNPVLSTELARRSVRVRLEPKVERPWERAGFKHPSLREWVDEHRGELIKAACILVQHWIVEGRPTWSGTPLGSYESWSRTMGGILETADIEGFLGNHRKLMEGADLESQALHCFVGKWAKEFKEPTIAANLLALATDCAIGLKGSDQRSRTVALGMKLNQLRGRLIGNHQVVPAGKSRGSKLWKLEQVRG